MSAYRCENRKASGAAVYTNVVPVGGFRGYGASQSTFAIECAMDELAGLLGISPFALRRHNMIRPTDWIESVWQDRTDIGFGSYGLDQCRGQIEGAIGMGIGWAPTGHMIHDAAGTLKNPSLRGDRIPAFADLPRSEVLFADTCDTIGPLGAKSQGECAINAVAPASANAVADATGVRFPHLPLTPDRMFEALAAASR